MLGLSQLFGKETVAGVDIGSRCLKVVQAEAIGNGRWRIAKAGVAPTPPDSVRDGVVVDKDAVAQVLRELLRTSNIDATTGAAAISGASVVVRHVKLPRVSESLLRKSIRFEAPKHIPSSVEDSQVEFEITGEVPGETDKMGVMLVAAPNEMIESRLMVLALAGLEPVAVDVEAFALQRALLDLGQRELTQDATLAVLDIGAVSTDVNIVCNGHFALTRNIAIAGDTFTNALKHLSRSTEWSDLEALKAQVDMAVLLDPEADPDHAALARAVQPTMDELLREVRRSINYYQSQLADPANSNLPVSLTPESTEGRPVTKLILTGGSAKMQGIAAYMTARLGLDAEPWNIFDNPALDTGSLPSSFLEESYPLLGIGVGLALKEMTMVKPLALSAPSKPSTSRKFAIPFAKKAA